MSKIKPTIVCSCRAVLMLCLLFAVFLPFFSQCAVCQECTPEVAFVSVSPENAGALLEAAKNLLSEKGRVSLAGTSPKLVIVDCPEHIERVSRTLKELDVRAKQVEVKVLFLETSSRALAEAGISSAQVVIPQSQFSGIVRFLKANKDTRIRSEMFVKTISNQPAAIRVTKDEVIGAEALVYKNGVRAVSPVRAPIGNVLEVLPRVNDDGTIAVIVRPSVSTLEKHSEPYERSLMTQVVVNDGDTVMLGGVNTEQRDVRKTGIFLGIPLGTRARTENSSMAMFLTPTVLD